MLNFVNMYFRPVSLKIGVCSRNPCCVHTHPDRLCLVPPLQPTDNLKMPQAVAEPNPCLLPGFRVLAEFLGHRVHVPEVYLILSSFFLQTPLTELTDGPKVDSGGAPGPRGHLAF